MPRPLLHRNQTEQTQESRLSLTAAPRETQREAQENAVQLARTSTPSTNSMQAARP